MSTPDKEREAFGQKRGEFEVWLMQEHGLDATWNVERNCYDEFPAHLAFKAWQAAAISARGAPSVGAEPVALPRPFVPGDEFNPRDYLVEDQMREHGNACRKDERQRTVAAEWEVCRLRGELQRIANECTARKAVMIARAALAAPPTKGESHE